MNSQKLVGIAAATIILIAGTIYLNIGKSALIPVLSVCALAILVMGIATACEAKKAGVKGIIAYIPAICYGILAAAVLTSVIYLCI